MAAGHTGVDKAAVPVHRLGGLGHIELVLHVGGHIVHLAGDPDGHAFAVLVQHLLRAAVGGLNKAVAVHPGIGGQIGDQADVGAFGGLDGAQAAVVGIVDVAHVEGGAVTAQTAGAQGGQAALVGQLRQGIGLVHELGQGGGAEELLNGGGDGPDVDEGLGRHNVQILNGHPFPDHPLHAGEADAELVLQQLAHAAQASVAQVVDIVGGTHAEGQAVEVIDGRHNIVHSDVLGDQLVHAVTDEVEEVLLAHCLGIPLVQQLLKDAPAHLLGDAGFGGIEVHKLGHVHHAVGEHLHHVHAGVEVVHLHHGLVDAQSVQLPGPLPGEHLARLRHDLAGGGVGHGGAQLLARQTSPDGQLLVEFVPAHPGQVVPPGVEEQGGQQALGGVDRGGFAGTQLAVDFQQGLLIALAGVLLQGGQDAGILAEQLDDARVAAGADGPDEAGDGQLAVFIDAHVEHVGQIGLILQPGPAVGDNGGGEGDVIRLVRIFGEVHAGGAHQLGDDDTLRAVDDEGARVGHDGEVAHENGLLLDLVGGLVAEMDLHLHGGGIGHVLGLALLNGVLGGVVHGEADEGQLQVARVVGDGVHIVEHLLEARLQEPLVGLLLDFQEVGHLQDILAAGEALALGLAVPDVFDRSSHMLFTLHFVEDSGRRITDTPGAVVTTLKFPLVFFVHICYTGGTRWGRCFPACCAHKQFMIP